MLRAILHSKSGKFEDIGGVPSNIAAILRNREDARTSTIFERLAYLPPDLMWKILCRATGGHILPRFQVVKLDSVEFWPTWKLSSDGRSRAEPDVFLRWRLGDPETMVDMIIEAKRSGEGVTQNRRQWLDQLFAYEETYLFHETEGEASARNGRAKSLVYLCVDGLGEKPTQAIESFEEAELPVSLPDLTIAGCSWQTIADAIGDMEKGEEFGIASKHLLLDIKDALRFCGQIYFHVRIDFSELPPPKFYVETLKHLDDLSFGFSRGDL